MHHISVTDSSVCNCQKTDLGAICDRASVEFFHARHGDMRSVLSEMEAKELRKACRAALDFGGTRWLGNNQSLRWSIDINFSKTWKKCGKKVLCFVAHERETSDDPSSCWLFWRDFLEAEAISRGSKRVWFKS